MEMDGQAEATAVLLDVMTQGFGLCELVRDDDGRAVSWRLLAASPAFERQLMPGAATGNGSARDERLHLGDGWVDRLDRVARTGAPEWLEHEVAALGPWYEIRIHPRGRDRLALLVDDITPRKRMELAQREGEERQAFLLALSDALRSLTDPVEVQTAAMRLLAERLDVMRATYFEVGPDQDGFTLTARFERDPAAIPERMRLSDFAPAMSDAYRAGRTLVFRDTETETQLGSQPAAYRPMSVRAWAAVPLVKAGRLVAIVGVHSRTPRDWTATEVQLLEDVAERTWAAVERARAEAALHLREARYRTLFDSIDEGFCIIEVLFDEAGQPHDYRFLETNLAFVRQTGLVDAVGRRMRELAPAHEPHWFEIYGRIALTGEPERFEAPAAALGRWYEVSAFRVDEPAARRVAILFTDIAERKRAETELREREERQSFLLELSDALRAQPDEQWIKEQTVKMLAEHLHLDRCYLSEVFEQQGYSTVGPEVVRPELSPMAGVHRLSDYPETMRQLATHPMIVDDAVSDPRFSEAEKALLASLPQRALLVAALRKGREVIWALVGAMATPRRWTEGERVLLEDVAERTWVAVERARHEAALRESEALLTGQKEAFEAAVDGKPLAEALGRLRDTAITFAGEGGQCGFYLADHDQKQLWHVVGMSDEFRECGDGVPIGADQPGCGLAVHTGEPVITPDALASERWTPWRWLAEKFRFRGVWSFPLKLTGGQAVGSFVLYFRDVREAAPRDYAFASVIAKAAAIIISRHQQAQERERAETSLRESEERYRTLFETMGQGYCDLMLVRDTDGRAVDQRYLEFNPAFERIFGIPVAQARGRTASEVFSELEPWWTASLDRIARAGAAERLEHEVASLGRWYEVYVYPRTRDRLTVLYEDITQRKRAEAALRESEARQAFLLQLSDAVRALADPLEIQATTARMLGAHLGVDRSMYAEVEGAPGAEVGTVRGQYVRPAGPGEPSLVRFPEHYSYAQYGARSVARRRTGEVLVVTDVQTDPTFEPAERDAWAAAQVSAAVVVPLIKGDAFVAEFGVHAVLPHAWTAGEIALVTDVAERTWAAAERARAETALRETQGRLEDALATARMAFWDWNHATDATLASASIHQLAGLRPDERLESSAEFFSLLHPDDRERQRALVEAAVAQGEGWHSEFRIVRPSDGITVWLEEHARVARGPDGRPVHTTGLVWDITDRKRAAAAAELERRTEEREALRRELAQAEEAERRRLARELHDQLGQQLTAIALGLDDAERLATPSGNGTAAERRTALRRRLEQLKALAGEMALSTRTLALELRPPELDDVGFEHALDTYVREWSARVGVPAELLFTGVTPGNLPAEIGTALYRIAQEALTNVARHARATAVTVLVTRGARDMRLIVEDDGLGFDDDATARRTAGGRRLGLGGMRERAALVGGTTVVESSPAGGTTVAVLIPLTGASANGEVPAPAS